MEWQTNFASDPVGKTLDLVFELMDMNIYERIRGFQCTTPLTSGRHHHLPETLIKSYMYQLVKGLDHIHRYLSSSAFFDY